MANVVVTPLPLPARPQRPHARVASTLWRTSVPLVKGRETVVHERLFDAAELNAAVAAAAAGCGGGGAAAEARSAAAGGVSGEPAAALTGGLCELLARARAASEGGGGGGDGGPCRTDGGGGGVAAAPAAAISFEPGSFLMLQTSGLHPDQPEDGKFARAEMRAAQVVLPLPLPAGLSGGGLAGGGGARGARGGGGAAGVAICGVVLVDMRQVPTFLQEPMTAQLGRRSNERIKAWLERYHG
jgi:hypothetical protein